MDSVRRLDTQSPTLVQITKGSQWYLECVNRYRTKLSMLPSQAMKDTGRNPHFVERRRYLRVPVQWKLWALTRCGQRVLESRTENLSVNGFYTVLPEPYLLGDEIRCTILVPRPHEDSKGVILECQVRVVRVEPDASGAGFGVACCILDYEVVPQPAGG